MHEVSETYACGITFTFRREISNVYSAYFYSIFFHQRQLRMNWPANHLGVHTGSAYVLSKFIDNEQVQIGKWQLWIKFLSTSLEPLVELLQSLRPRGSDFAELMAVILDHTKATHNLAAGDRASRHLQDAFLVAEENGVAMKLCSPLELS